MSYQHFQFSYSCLSITTSWLTLHGRQSTEGEKQNLLSFLFVLREQTLGNISKCYIPSKFLSPTFIWNLATIIAIHGWNLYSLFFHPSKQWCRTATGRVKSSLLPVSVNSYGNTAILIHSLTVYDCFQARAVELALANIHWVYVAGWLQHTLKGLKSFDIYLSPFTGEVCWPLI